MAYIIGRSLEDKYNASRALLVGDVEPMRAFLRKQSSYGSFSVGRRIPAELVPVHARMDKGKRFYDCFNNFQFADGVSKRFKDLVEEIEPGVHQFFPVELFLQDGVTPYGEPFWLLNVATRVDAIALEHSNMYKQGEDGQFGPIDFEGMFNHLAKYVEKSGLPSLITVYKDRIAGRALWCDHRFGARTFCSEAMMAGMRAQGMQGYGIKFTVNEI